MTTLSATAPGRPARKRRSARGGSLSAASSLGRGVALLWFSILVLIPLAMVVATAGAEGWSGFWRVVSNSQTYRRLQMTGIQALLVVGENVVMGTVIAWVVERDRFPGKTVLDCPAFIPSQQRL